MVVPLLGFLIATPALSGFDAEQLAVPAGGPDTACVVMEIPTEGRLSPLDSLTFTVGEHSVKICYGRPSARGRTMIGGRDVPYDRLWRTGANEPTMIHTTGPIQVAGIALEPGSYSFYTEPGDAEWTVIVNRSITQWGHIARYTHRVKEQEVGRAKVDREWPPEHVETLRFTAGSETNSTVALTLEWEQMRIRVPITAVTELQ